MNVKAAPGVTGRMVYVLLLPGMVALAGCATGGGGTPAPQEDVTEVEISGIAFVPMEVTIRRGESVRWTNTEPTPILHTVTSGNPGEEGAGDAFDSGSLTPGDGFTQTFDEVGEFTYFCRIHSDAPEMRGATVTVIEE